MVGVVGGLALVAGAGTLVLACDVYDTSLLAPLFAPGETVAGVGWWSGKGDRGCLSALGPRESGRPPRGSAVELPPILMALQSVRFGAGAEDADAWKRVGYDLDGRCTASETCEGADSPLPCQPTVPQVPIDGLYCRDNTFGRLAAQVEVVPEVNKYGLGRDELNCALCVGYYNYLIRLSGYSGLPDDDRVKVDYLPSPGLESPLPWDCTDPSWKQKPCFTPDMPWQIEEDALVDPTAQGDARLDSKVSDPDAYVKDGYLVARLPDDTLFWMPGRRGPAVAFPLRLTKARFSGKIVRGGDGVFRIEDGVIAGRASGAEIVKGIRLIGLCESDPNYPLITDFLTKNLDLLANGENDPAATCDALSVGVSFVGQQATPGANTVVPPLRECEPPK